MVSGINESLEDKEEKKEKESNEEENDLESAADFLSKGQQFLIRVAHSAASSLTTANISRSDRPKRGIL